MAYGVSSYKRTSIQTADRRKLVVMLYEGAIKNLRQARAFMEAGQLNEQGVKINKTLEIIKFLDNALDHAQGGEIASRLAALYAYMRDTLILANVEKKLERIDEVINLLNTVLEGWRGIIEAGNDTVDSTLSAETSEQSAAMPRIVAAG